MKKITIKAVALLGSVLILSSCIGSFRLSGNVLAWNKEVSNSKFVNELVFLAFCIVPVYEVAMLADAVVINSIEFWSGANPIALNGDFQIDGQKGKYIVKEIDGNYKLVNKKSGVATDLNFDASTQTWSLEANGKSQKLVTLKDASTAVVYNADGSSREVALQ